MRFLQWHDNKQLLQSNYGGAASSRHTTTKMIFFVSQELHKGSQATYTDDGSGIGRVFLCYNEKKKLLTRQGKSAVAFQFFLDSCSSYIDNPLQFQMR